jgi:hypothetical protein
VLVAERIAASGKILSSRGARKKLRARVRGSNCGRRQEEQRGASSRSASSVDPTTLSRAKTTLFRTKIGSCFSIVELVQVPTVSVKEDAGKSVYSVCRFSLIEWDGSRMCCKFVVEPKVCVDDR